MKHIDPCPYHLHSQLTDNQPAVVEIDYVGKRTFRFQFHGPKTGYGSYLEVERDDGVAHRFGPGNCINTLWLAFYHIETGWEKQPVPPYRLPRLRDEYDPPIKCKHGDNND